MFLLPLFELVSSAWFGTVEPPSNICSDVCVCHHGHRRCLAPGVFSVVAGITEGCSCSIRHGGLRAGVVMGPPGLDSDSSVQGCIR